MLHTHQVSKIKRTDNSSSIAQKKNVIGKNGNLALSIFGTNDPTIPSSCMYQTEMYAFVHQEIKPKCK